MEIGSELLTCDLAFLVADCLDNLADVVLIPPLALGAVAGIDIAFAEYRARIPILVGVDIVFFERSKPVRMWQDADVDT